MTVSIATFSQAMAMDEIYDNGGLPSTEIYLGAFNNLEKFSKKEPQTNIVNSKNSAVDASGKTATLKNNDKIQSPVKPTNDTSQEFKPTDDTSKQFKPTGFVEAGGNYSHLTNDFNSWSGGYVKGEVQTDPNNRWNAEILHEREFGDDGNYGAIGNTHNFNENWYSSVNIGAADRGFFLPRYRIDAFLNRKWLENKSLITTIGFGEYKARDTYRDESLFFGLTYYFPKRWILQGGIRYNNSTPGNIDSFSEFVAVTEGEYKKHFLTLRYGFGKESYQIIGPSNSISDFKSDIISLELRQWVYKNWGFNAKGEYYHNPNYNRTGINLGVFYEF
ncbi:MAG: YaiO family outer membrane beta-barrel protein [Pseudomonadota bacterium]